MHIYLFIVKQISNATKWNTNSRVHIALYAWTHTSRTNRMFLKHVKEVKFDTLALHMENYFYSSLRRKKNKKKLCHEYVYVFYSCSLKLKKKWKFPKESMILLFYVSRKCHIVVEMEKIKPCRGWWKVNKQTDFVCWRFQGSTWSDYCIDV